MAKLECFYETEALPKKFIAIYADGSGCSMWRKVKRGFENSADPELVAPDLHWFMDAGYLWFIALPDDFKFWGENDTANH